MGVNTESVPYQSTEVCVVTKFAIPCLMIWCSLACQTSEPAEDRGLPDYVIDSGFETGLNPVGIMSSTYWLDGDRVLAIGRAHRTGMQPDKTPIIDQGLYIWKIGEKPVRFGDYNVKIPYCYADGRILVKLREQEKALSGPIENPNTVAFLTKNPPTISALRAAEVPCPDFLKSCFPLREGDGYLRFNRDPVHPKKVEWWSGTGEKSVELPIYASIAETVKYVRFLDKYLIKANYSGGSFPPLNWNPSKQWKETGCWPAWLVSPDGQTEEICIRYGPWAQGGQLEVWPTTKGYFVARSHSGGTGPAAYLLADEGYKILLNGWIEAPSVSPDGTKISLGYSKKSPRLPPAGESAEDYRQTLMVIDLNKVNLKHLIPYEKSGR
jgi:hypothetical protein